MVNFEGFNFVSVDGLGSASDCRGVLINNNGSRKHFVLGTHVLFPLNLHFAL